LISLTQIMFVPIWRVCACVDDDPDSANHLPVRTQLDEAIARAEADHAAAAARQEAARYKEAEAAAEARVVGV
jgi:hypothetical protein